MSQSFRLIEPVPIEDEFCSGVALIEELESGMCRLVIYARQTHYETSQAANVVKRKLVLSIEALENGNKAVRAFLNSRPRRHPLRLVE